MFKKRKCVIVMYKIGDVEWNKALVTTSRITYAELFEKAYEYIKKQAEKENDGHFYIVNVIKL